MYNDFEIRIPGNTGLQNEPIHPSERMLGEKGVEPPDLMPDGHGWTIFQPSFDYQVFADGDGNICVPTSIANGGEYTSNYLKSNDIELADWFYNNGFIDDAGSVKYNNAILAVGSGTNPNAGNTPSRVYDYVKKNGFSPQSARPYNNSWTKARLYQVLSQAEEDSGKPWLDKFNFTYYTLPVSTLWGNTHTPEQLIRGLKKGTPRVSVDGNYERRPDGLIGGQGRSGNFYNWTHSVTLRDFEYGKWWEIHDHYTNQIIKFEWIYKFGNSRVGIITPKDLGGKFVKIKGTPRIGVYGLGGEKKDKLGIFRDGDDLKFFYGTYGAANPKIELDPDNQNDAVKIQQALNIYLE